MTHTANLLESGSAQPQALSDGFSLAFWVGAGLALASLVAPFGLLRRQDLRVGAQQPAPAPAG